MRNLKLIAIVILLGVLQVACSACSLDHKMSVFQNKLRSISPDLNGSIISVSSDEYNFSCSSKNVTEDSQFYIGSNTKQMTAYMFLKELQRQHPAKDLEMLLEETLVDIFPHSKILPLLERKWIGKVTVLDLLTHRSGLQDYIEVYEFQFRAIEDLNKTIDPIDILRSVAFDPKKKYNYSNTNYYLLGKLTEEVAQRSFEECFDEMVRKPVNMPSSYAPIQGNYYHLKREGRFVKLLQDLNDHFFIDMGNAIGAGNVISSSKDLHRWNFYLNSVFMRELKEIILKKYFQDEEDWVQIGLSSVETDMGILTCFQGGLDSFHSFLGYFPDYGLSVVVLSNNLDDFQNLMDLFQNVLIKEVDCDAHETSFCD